MNGFLRTGPSKNTHNACFSRAPQSDFRVAVLALERSLDDDAGNGLAEPGGDLIALQFQSGEGSARPFPGGQYHGNCRTVRRRGIGIQPSLRQRAEASARSRL